MVSQRPKQVPPIPGTDAQNLDGPRSAIIQAARDMSPDNFQSGGQRRRIFIALMPLDPVHSLIFKYPMTGRVVNPFDTPPTGRGLLRVDGGDI